MLNDSISSTSLNIRSKIVIVISGYLSVRHKKYDSNALKNHDERRNPILRCQMPPIKLDISPNISVSNLKIWCDTNVNSPSHTSPLNIRMASQRCYR